VGPVGQIVNDHDFFREGPYLSFPPRIQSIVIHYQPGKLRHSGQNRKGILCVKLPIDAGPMGMQRYPVILRKSRGQAPDDIPLVFQ
jgi:hypothetical protein